MIHSQLYRQERCQLHQLTPLSPGPPHCMEHTLTDMEVVDLRW